MNDRSKIFKHEKMCFPGALTGHVWATLNEKHKAELIAGSQGWVKF